MSAAWKLDQGGLCAQGSLHGQGSCCQHCCIWPLTRRYQLNGARGYSKDTILEWIYRYARQARILDGADEVHKMVLAQTYAQERTDFWSWGN